MYANLTSSEFLYKFVPDDIYTIENLVSNKLYLNSPCNFNDPYDFPPIWGGNGNKTQYEEIESFFSNIDFSILPLEIKEIGVLNKKRDEIKFGDIKHKHFFYVTNIFSELLKKLVKACSLCELKESRCQDSLPGSENSIAMFAHYAKK